MTAKFVLKRSVNGDYQFNLYAADGEVIATSQLYRTKASAERGIEAVRAYAAQAAVEDRCELAIPKPKPPARMPARPVTQG